MPIENTVKPEQAKPTVYIADSDQEVGNSIRFLLATDNINAEVFSDGQTLLGKALSSPPSCVVIEAALPGVTGVALLNSLREHGLQIPVIILATTNDVSMAVAAVKSGAWDYFEKPFLQRVLLGSVQDALREKSGFVA